MYLVEANKFKGARDAAKALGATTTLGTGDVILVETEASRCKRCNEDRLEAEEAGRLIDETTNS